MNEDKLKEIEKAAKKETQLHCIRSMDTIPDETLPIMEAMFVAGALFVSESLTRVDRGSELEIEETAEKWRDEGCFTQSSKECFIIGAQSRKKRISELEAEVKFLKSVKKLVSKAKR